MHCRRAEEELSRFLGQPTYHVLLCIRASEIWIIPASSKTVALKPADQGAEGKELLRSIRRFSPR